jgi:hypothetical protein
MSDPFKKFVEKMARLAVPGDDTEDMIGIARVNVHRASSIVRSSHRMLQCRDGTPASVECVDEMWSGSTGTSYNRLEPLCLAKSRVGSP